MHQKFNYIGKSISRIDGPDKVTGKTEYLMDMTVDNMVYAYPIYSTIPFGYVKHVDLSPVKTQDEFIDAVFAHHIPGENQVGVILEDQPLLADTTVRYIGDSIGVLVADTEEAAFRLSRQVLIEYEELDPCFSIKSSKAAEKTFIHDSNIACSHKVIKGDIEKGFQQADMIIEADFKTPFQEHYYLEPQGCIIIPEKDRVKIYGSLQCPYYVQKAVSRVLDMPPGNVRVIQAPTGGAFGGKEDIPSEICARAAVAAKMIERPVKMVYRRHDDVQLTSKRHPFQMHFKVGVSKTGKLISADITLEENAGAYATLSSVVSYRAAMQAMGPYVIPNIQVHSHAYYTNLPPAGAFRGFGSPQATFGHERMMDVIADRLAMDPIALRLKNVLKPGDTTLTDHRLTVSVGAEETIKKAASSVEAHWNGSQPDNKGSNRYREGFGVAVCHYGNCLGAAGWHMDGAGVKITLLPDGSISVSYGLVEMGQGANTVVAQMTAEALGVPVGRIKVLPTDSLEVPDSGPSVASRNVVMTGNAIRDAADKLLPVLRSAAGELLGCESHQVDIQKDKVTDRTSGDSKTFLELVDFLFSHNYSTYAQGWWHVPELNYDPERGLGEAYFTYSYATHIAKVRVDTFTGQVDVQKIWASHDVGQALNPAGLEGQIEGGTAQGVGWALMENFQVEKGRVITPNLSTYLLPTCMDVGEVETILVEDPEPLGPWGAKGVGEPAIIPTGAAVANAVSNALGIQFNEIPITPERILNAITAKPVPEKRI